jgi:uncharacterized protein (TIGR02996 family)
MKRSSEVCEVLRRTQQLVQQPALCTQSEVRKTMADIRRLFPSNSSKIVEAASEALPLARDSVYAQRSNKKEATKDLPSARDRLLLLLEPLLRRPKLPAVTVRTAEELILEEVIAANPDDEAPQLAYYDVLRERGDPRGPVLHFEAMARRILGKENVYTVEATKQYLGTVWDPEMLSQLENSLFSPKILEECSKEPHLLIPFPGTGLKKLRAQLTAENRALFDALHCYEYVNEAFALTSEQPRYLLFPRALLGVRYPVKDMAFADLFNTSFSAQKRLLKKKYPQYEMASAAAATFSMALHINASDGAVFSKPAFLRTNDEKADHAHVIVGHFGRDAELPVDSRWDNVCSPDVGIAFSRKRDS